jgi:hypothetical protein
MKKPSRMLRYAAVVLSIFVSLVRLVKLLFE